jgi:hypothetical protein
MEQDIRVMQEGKHDKGCSVSYLFPLYFCVFPA